MEVATLQKLRRLKKQFRGETVNPRGFTRLSEFILQTILLLFGETVGIYMLRWLAISFMREERSLDVIRLKTVVKDILIS